MSETEFTFDPLAELLNGDAEGTHVTTVIEPVENPFPAISVQPESTAPTGAVIPSDSRIEKMLDFIKTPEEYGYDRGYKGLLYGPPGSGKTVMSCASQKHQTYLLGIEPGGHVIRKHKECSKVKIVDAAATKNPVAFAEDFIGAVGAGKFPDCELLVVDTYTSLRERDLQNILASEGKQFIMDKNADEYRPNSQNMKRIARMLTDLSCHVIIICHSEEVVDKARGTNYTKPVLSKSVQEAMLGLLDFIAYYEWNGDLVDRKFRLTVNPQDNLMAKNRLALTESVYMNPTVDMILEA